MIKKSQDENQYITYGQMNLINDFRSLWTELVIWLRSYMVSTITGFSDLTAISNRLYHIPDDFKEKFEPFFGVELAGEFEQLYLMFIVHAQTLITALKINDQQAIDTATAALYKAADEMADFLARINPYWNKSQWQNLLYQFLDMAISEVHALLSKEYDTEIEIRARMLKHALMLGDYTAAGVMHYLTPALPEFPLIPEVPTVPEIIPTE